MVCPSNWGFCHFDGDDRSQPLADVLPPEGDGRIFLYNAIFLRDGIDCPGDGAAEPFKMSTALAGVNRVDVAEYFLVIPGGILHGDLDLELVLGVLLVHINRYRVETLCAFIDKYHKLGETSIIAVGLCIPRPFIRDYDGNPGI